MFKRFPETNSRIKRNRHGVNTALYGAPMLLSKKISYFRDNVSVSRFHLHRPRISLHVHDNETRFAFGNQRHHFFVASSSGNVVYNRSSCLDCRMRNFGLRSIDRDQDVDLSPQFLDHVNDTAHFFFCRDTFGAGSRRFATNVNDLRALFRHFQSVLDRFLSREKFSSIRE